MDPIIQPLVNKKFHHHTLPTWQTEQPVGQKYVQYRTKKEKEEKESWVDIISIDLNAFDKRALSWTLE